MTKQHGDEKNATTPSDALTAVVSRGSILVPPWGNLRRLTPPTDQSEVLMAAKKMLTVSDVKKAVRDIEARTGDNESAHGAEDALYVRVLEAIADGRCQDPRAAAGAALKAAEIDYDRWYA